METVNGVFEGGGVRGVALAGAAAGAMDSGVTFEQAVGTSAGSLVAALVAAGYRPDELSLTVCRLDWSGLLDPVPGMRVPLIGKHLALLTRHGLHHGDRLEERWGELLAARGIRTFGDLRPGSLRVVATDITHAEGVVFPDTLPGYGYDPNEFPVARALRMSAAVPFLFRPVPLRDRTTGERVLFADGAMAANFPSNVADRNRSILGFRLQPTGEHPHAAVRGPASLAKAVMMSGVRARYTLPPPSDDGLAVLTIPVSADLDFDISNDDARRIFDAGRSAAIAQLALLQISA